MKNKELYQATFSQLHSSTEIRWEDYQTMKRTHRRAGTLLLAAAVVALLAALTTAAVATDFFGLRKVLLPQQTAVQLPDEEGAMTSVQVDVIGLSGYMGTPESLALAEWQDFLDHYDVSAAAHAADQNPGQVDSKYSLYSVYNQEMAGKLDEIIDKYGLKLHTALATVLPEEWTGLVGSFLAENHMAYAGYIYEDGTFAYDGEAYLPGCGITSYQFRRAVRGSFDVVILNIGDVSQYQEWSYTTQGGTAVCLALGPSKGLLIADLEDSFVTVNVLLGSGGGLTAESLEALADGFDFAALTPAAPPQIAEEPVNEAPPAQEEDPLYLAAAIETSVAQDFYSEFVRAIKDGRRLGAAEMIDWPRTVTTPEGSFTLETAEDFLPYYDDIFTPSLLESIDANQFDETRADLFPRSGMVGGAGGAIWFALVEDGRISVFTVQNAEGWSIRAVDPSAPVGAPPAADVYVGEYSDPDTGEPGLEIQKSADGAYQLTINIFRLAYLDDGAGTAVDGGIEFSATAPNGETLRGRITLADGVATVSFTNEVWSEYSSISEYQYRKISDLPNL